MELRRIAALVGVAGAFAWAAAATPAEALDNGLALTPPMGYNDWNAFGCNVSAKLIEETADAMVANGMKDAGYQYVTMDDCWMAGQNEARGSATRVTAGRDATTGKLIPDPTNFPDGIKAVADYVHARGLKLGIYEDVGTATCQGLAGSYQHEAIDAQTFADWGVDYLKYDFCNVPTTGEFAGKSTTEIAKTLYGRMRDALAATGRPIVFSMSLALTTGLDQQTWAGDYGNLWRTTPDISDTWASVVSIFKQNVNYAAYAGPGHWNDPDMLEIGNGGMTTNEYRSHFSLWAIMAAPLIAGSDVRTETAANLAIMTNKDVIAVDQDALGKQGTVLAHTGGQWVIEKDLSGGDKAVLFFNESATPAKQSVSLSDLGLSSGHAVRDLWAHTDSEVAGTLTARVEGHGVALFRIDADAAPAGTAPHTAITSTVAEAIVEPDHTTTLTGTLTNDGTTAVDASLPVSVPAGWTAMQTTAPASSVAGGASTSGTWTVHVPAEATPGAYTVSVGGAASTITVPPPAPAASAYVSDLEAMTASGTYTPNGAVVVNGSSYAHGILTAQGSDLSYYVGGRCTTLTGLAAVDDTATGRAGTTPSAELKVLVDGVTVFDQTVLKGAPVQLHQSLAGAKTVELVAVPLSGFGRALPVDWADAHLDCATTVTGGGAGGTVPATLSLMLGSPAAFGAFTPGLDHTYTATTTANVISTAGDATLSVSDPGHLANGAFELADPLQVAFSKSTWDGPVSNDPVTVAFSQHIGATDPLRTGAYSRTLTFTLSTTSP